MQKIKDLNQEIRKLSAFKADEQTLWLLEVLYSTIWFIGSKESCMQKFKFLTQEIRKS